MTSASIDAVFVSINFDQTSILVGRLAYVKHQIYFEYDTIFLQKGLPLSPFKLPLKSGVQTFDADLFDGLPGVFDDSLPDGWGRLLLDRSLRSQGILPQQLNPLDRLSHVGQHGMGALTYQPDHSYSENKVTEVSLDQLATQAHEVLTGDANTVFNELLLLNGSSAGARPKALIGVNPTFSSIIYGVDDLPAGYQPWLVKFNNSQEGLDSGAIEYAYAQMAQLAGINMSHTYLFPAKKSAGFFASQRFDRIQDNHQQKRLHMHSACGLLHANFRIPALDYQDLINATYMLTKDTREVEKMFRLAVFNVLTHNRDDHSKNFSFLMNEFGQWQLAPAYDLTFSTGPGGEQSTMVMGEGRNPGIDHLTKLGRFANMNTQNIKAIIAQTQEALNQWNNIATHAGVSRTNRQQIHAFLSSASRKK